MQIAVFLVAKISTSLAHTRCVSYLCPMFESFATIVIVPSSTLFLHSKSDPILRKEPDTQRWFDNLASARANTINHQRPNPDHFYQKNGAPTGRTSQQWYSHHHARS